MISKEEALRIIAEAAPDGVGPRILDIEAYEDIRRKPNVFWPDLRNHWIAYVAQPGLAIRSSLIIAVDRETGEVRYRGTASDEG